MLAAAAASSCQECAVHEDLALTVVVLGASGDLATKKTYPALYALWNRGFLPKKRLRIVGYARSDMSDEDLRTKLATKLPSEASDFLQLCSYFQGQYDSDEDFSKLATNLQEFESAQEEGPIGRLYYLALPPSVYPRVCEALKRNCDDMDRSNDKSWLRVIVEKPFGKDSESSAQLSEQLGALYGEDQLFRIDHYLGKEISQNMLIMRFGNMFMAPIWNRNYVDNVQITFKEDFGTQGRGGYFDAFGIIRDVMQNHLMQVLALVAMEKPVSMMADDVRDEKLKVTRCIRPVVPEDVVLGQYTAGGDEPGYLEDEGVPNDSSTPTFATAVLHVENERWAGVPFILKAGKALNERKAEVRVQLRSCPAFHYGGDSSSDALRNEFVMRIQPDEAIYMKMVVKEPGLEMASTMSELDLSYQERYQAHHIPDAYERLILDSIRGDQQHFVRSDELRAAWAVWTPLLHQVDAGELTVLPYTAGSRGPEESDKLVAAAGFVKGDKYTWRPYDGLGEKKDRESLEKAFQKS